jgi:uncharacterized hydantoinase/oxoprolinase family protein
MLVASVGRVPPDAPVVAAGIGAGVVREIARRLDRNFMAFEALIDVAPQIGEAVSHCAPAAALALLASSAIRVERPPTSR